MRVSYIGNTPAFQAGKVGSIPTTRSIKQLITVVFLFYIEIQSNYHKYIKHL